jgi:chromosome segregation ATPase
VPVQRLNETLRQLSALADVKSLSQSGVDVTAQVTSLEDQLQRVRADRRGLLRRLANAKTEQEATAIKQRLRLVQSQINGLRGRLNAQRERVSYAQVSVTLAVDEKSGSGSGTSGAVDDFLNTLEDSLAIALRVLGVLIPLALVTSLLWLGGSWWQRRRRESALG